MKEFKKRNLEQAEIQAIELEDLGHSIFRSTDYHWKLDGNIDIWPSVKKYMGRDKKIHFYENLIDIVNRTKPITYSRKATEEDIKNINKNPEDYLEASVEDKIFHKVSNRIIITFSSFTIILFAIGFFLGFVVGSL